MHPDKSLRGMFHSRDRMSMHIWLVALCTLTVGDKALGTQAHGHDAPVPIYGGIDDTYRVPAGAWSNSGGQEGLVNAAAHALHCRRSTVKRGERRAREGHAGGPQHGKKGGQVEAEMGTGCCGRGMAVGGRWRPNRRYRGPIRDAPLDQCPQMVDATPGVRTGPCVCKLGGWCLGQIPYVCANGSLSTLDALHVTPDGPKTCLRQLPCAVVTFATAFALQDEGSDHESTASDIENDGRLLVYEQSIEQMDVTDPARVEWEAQREADRQASAEYEEAQSARAARSIAGDADHVEAVANIMSANVSQLIAMQPQERLTGSSPYPDPNPDPSPSTDHNLDPNPGPGPDPDSNQDIYAGFNHMLRGGTIPYIEYMQVSHP